MACCGAAIARVSTFHELRLWIIPLPQEYETSPTTVTDTGQKPIANPATSDVPATNNATCRSHDVRRILASFIAQVTCSPEANAPYTSSSERRERKRRSGTFAEAGGGGA